MIEELADRIIGGTFPAGSTLPTEPMLGETFGVSRSVLREAIKAVEAMGLVKVQQGQGTTVLAQVEWDLVNPVVLAAVIRHDAAWSVLDHLVTVRRALESQMARRAAELITEEGKRIVNERMADLELAVEDADAFSAADVAFHDAILPASGNSWGERSFAHSRLRPTGACATSANHQRPIGNTPMRTTAPFVTPSNGAMPRRPAN